MAVEAKRGCGYRKVGGLYLVARGLGVPCDRLPYPLHLCPTCGGGIKQSRGFQYIAGKLLEGPPPCKDAAPGCRTCPVCNPNSVGKLGLMWVGEEHYATPADWCNEAGNLGVSKRISAVPKDFEFGSTWVLVAHPKAVRPPCFGCNHGLTREKDKGGVWHHTKADNTKHLKEHGYSDAAITSAQAARKELTAANSRCQDMSPEHTPGIFHAFRPEACELIVTKSMRRQRWVKALQRKLGDNLRLVEVPEGDKDHAPTVRQSARKRAMAKVARKAAAAAGEEE